MSNQLDEVVPAIYRNSYVELRLEACEAPLVLLKSRVAGLTATFTTIQMLMGYIHRASQLLTQQLTPG